MHFATHVPKNVVILEDEAMLQPRFRSCGLIDEEETEHTFIKGTNFEFIIKPLEHSTIGAIGRQGAVATSTYGKIKPNQTKMLP